MKPYYAETPEALAAFCDELRPWLAAGVILCLEGPLGAGKTTLVGSLVAALGGDVAEVHSPTFSLVHQYETPVYSVIHCDFYRLSDNSHLDELGGIEFFDEEALYCLEWSERVKTLLAQVPNKKVFVKITMSHPGRTLEIFPD